MEINYFDQAKLIFQKTLQTTLGFLGKNNLNPPPPRLLMDDLSLVSTDDLIEELGRRFDHWNFTGYTPLSTPSAEEPRNKFLQEWHGNPHTVIGALHISISHIVRDYQDNQHHLDSDEDF